MAKGEGKAKVDRGGELVQGEVEVRPVEVALIDVGEQQLRHDPNDDDIVELAADIAAKGLLQPIGLARADGGRFQLLWGSRRLAAHVRLRARTVLARLYDNPDCSVRVLALTENLQRAQLTLSEECDAVCYLHEVEKRSPDQISVLLSKSRAWVMRRLALPSLPVEVREGVLDGTLSVGAGEEIARIDDAGVRAYVYQQAVAANLSVSQVRGLREAYEASGTQAAAVDAGVSSARVANQGAVVLMTCPVCGAARPCGELTIVRVCGEHLSPAPLGAGVAQ